MCTADWLITRTSNRRRSSALARIVAPAPPPTITTRFLGIASSPQNADDGHDLVGLVLNGHDLVARFRRPRLDVGLDPGVGRPEFDDVSDLRAPVGERKIGNRPGARRAPGVDKRPWCGCRCAVHRYHLR